MTLEEKARELHQWLDELWWLDDDDCGSIASKCPRCGAILALLRQVAEEAKREEAAEWEPMLSKALSAIRDDGETEGDWIGPLEDELDEFLRRRVAQREP